MQFGQVELSNLYLIKLFTREQDKKHKTSNDGQRMPKQSDKTGNNRGKHNNQLDKKER